MANRPASVAAVLVLLVIAVFGQTSGFGFINFDDDRYVSNNPVVHRGVSLEGVEFAFSVQNGFYWHPLTWLTLMAECSLAGPNAAVHHSVNVVLHAAAVVFVFLFFQRATGHTARSAVAAALFGLHPLRAESVAWIAERKDVLLGCFASLSLLLYARYVERPVHRRYIAVVGAVILALLSKPAAVSLPLLLLVADYWPLRRRDRWPALLREKLPLFACSAAVSVLTWVGQDAAGALSLMQQVPLGVRILKSAEWLWRYIGRTFWPAGLVLPYQYDPTVGAAALFWAAAFAVTAAVVVYRRRHPYLLAGWLWFVVALLPSLGFVQAGGQSTADRFTYLPHVGFFAALVWLSADMLPGRVATLCATAAVCAAVISSARQTAHWRDSVSLFTHTIRHTPENWVARAKLGAALLDAAKYTEAEVQLREAVRQQPASFHAFYDLGRSLAANGNQTDAAAAFERATALNATYADAHYARGAMLLQTGRPAEAEFALRQALRFHLDPRYVSEAHNLLGTSMAQQSRIAEALAEFEAALQTNPSNANAQRNAATARQALAIGTVPKTPARSRTGR